MDTCEMSANTGLMTVKIHNMYMGLCDDVCCYVPIINGGICNHETGERYSGKVDFLYRT